MEGFSIKNLVLMLEKGDISKDELILNINKIKFRSVFSDPTREFNDKELLRRTCIIDESLNNALTTSTSFRENTDKSSRLLFSNTSASLSPNKSSFTNPTNHTQEVSNNRQVPSVLVKINKISSLSLARRVHHSASKASKNLRSTSLMKYLQSKESQMKALESLRETLDSYRPRRDSSTGDRLLRRSDKRTSKRIIKLANLNINSSLAECYLKTYDKFSIEETKEYKKAKHNNKIAVKKKKSEYTTPKGAASKVDKKASVNFSKPRNGSEVMNKKKSSKEITILNTKFLNKKFSPNHYNSTRPSTRFNKESPKEYKKILSSDRLLEHIDSKAKVASCKNMFNNNNNVSLLKAVQNIDKLQFNINVKTGVKTQQIIRNLKEQMNACVRMVENNTIRKRSNPVIVVSQ